MALPETIYGQYQTGTATVTSGSAVVTGTGTIWNGQKVGATVVNVGDLFTIDDSRFYFIKSVDSATQITLDKPYVGSTASGQQYRIVYLAAAHFPTDTATKVARTIERYERGFITLGECQTILQNCLSAQNATKGSENAAAQSAANAAQSASNASASQTAAAQSVSAAEASKNAAASSAATASSAAQTAVNAKTAAEGSASQAAASASTVASSLSNYLPLIGGIMQNGVSKARIYIDPSNEYKGASFVAGEEWTEGGGIYLRNKGASTESGNVLLLATNGQQSSALTITPANGARYDNVFEARYFTCNDNVSKNFAFMMPRSGNGGYYLNGDRAINEWHLILTDFDIPSRVAPTPKYGAGIGQVVNWHDTTSYTLPAGGTWLTWIFTYTTDHNYAAPNACGFYAGGTAFNSNNAGILVSGLAWRVV